MIEKKGFTLIELLSVIVILAIILAIAIPGISEIVNNTTKNAFKSDAKMILKQLEYEKLKDDNFDITTVDVATLSTFNLSNNNYNNLLVGTIDNEPYIVIIGKNKWNGLKACGTRKNMAVVPSGDAETCEILPLPLYNALKEVNRPLLAAGMTPIKWDETAWVDTTEDDEDWYNYTTTDKKWANAQTADGSFWVWIPRYIYKLSSGWHTNTAGTIDIQFSKRVDDNWNKGVIGEIDLDETANASNNKWTNHPAFTFGTTELTGIWVAKFEASGTTSAVDFKPNVISLRSVTISDMFTATRNMETNNRYGWGTSGTDIDTHMMKNSEWGAVAYLSKSIYGQNTNEIWINPAINYTTGCAGDSVSSASTTGCLRRYETTNGVKASTTGTIYGIYDMSGGVWEYTSAYVNNGNTSLTTYGSSIMSAAAKYKDIYAMGSSDSLSLNYVANMKKGDALYETSSTGENSTSWFADYSYMPYTSHPWFLRGGHFYDTTDAGAFHFYTYDGSAYSTVSFRSVVLVGTGL